MNMVTRNMNNSKNNAKSIEAHIWIVKETKEDTRGYTELSSWHDMESKWSLPSSKPILASYALVTWKINRSLSQLAITSVACLVV